MTLNTKSRRNFDLVATAAQAKGILYAKSGFLVYENFTKREITLKALITLHLFTYFESVLSLI